MNLASLSPNSRPIDASCNHTACGFAAEVMGESDEELILFSDQCSVHPNDVIAGTTNEICIPQDAILWKVCLAIRGNDPVGGLFQSGFDLTIFRNTAIIHHLTGGINFNGAQNRFCFSPGGPLWRACDGLSMALDISPAFGSATNVRARVSVDFKMP